MKQVTRRRALLGAGSLGTVALAGCLDETTAGDAPGTDADNQDVSIDVFQIGPALSRPAWADDGTVDTPGFVDVADSEDELPTLGGAADVDDLEAWLDETDFDDSVVVFVGSVGPNTCYTEVAVDDVRVTAAPTEDWDGGPVIAGTAEAVDTSGETEACGEAITYPSALVRVTGDDLPADAAFTITNGWDETGTVTAAERRAAPSVDTDALPGYVRPSSDPRTVPESLECDDEAFRRHWSPDDDVSWGELRDEDGDPTLELRVHNPQYDGDDPDRALEFERGDVVAVSLTNVADEAVETGNRNKYSLEVSTADGWTDVRGAFDDVALEYTDEAIVHDPGEGFEWAFELTDGGVVADHDNADSLAVCPGLPEGRYRFVFWGAIGDEAPAVAFDLVG